MHQTITWTNVHHILWYHMVSPDHNGLISQWVLPCACFSIYFHMWYNVFLINLWRSNNNPIFLFQPDTVGEWNQYFPSSGHQPPSPISLPTCPICQKTFTAMWSLRRHVQTTHQLSNQTYKCRYCSHTAKRKDNMKRHELTCSLNPTLSSGHVAMDPKQWPGIRFKIQISFIP